MDQKKICKVVNDDLIDVMLYVQFTGKSLMTEETFVQALREIKEEVDKVSLKLQNILFLLDNTQIFGEKK